MNAWRWLRHCISGRGKVLSVYHRGVARAKRHDAEGAISDYTAVIDMPSAPADVIAMALYNRAVVQVAKGDEQGGADDLEAIFEMKEAPPNVKKMAKQKLARMETRATHKTERQEQMRSAKQRS